MSWGINRRKCPKICGTHAISLVVPRSTRGSTFTKRCRVRIRHVLCCRLVTVVKFRMAWYYWYYIVEITVRLVLLAITMWVYCSNVLLYECVELCRVLERLEPFERVILKEEMWQYQYPFVPNTVPSYAVIVSSYSYAIMIFYEFFRSCYRQQFPSLL